jgi:hypothetical protein
MGGGSLIVCTSRLSEIMERSEVRQFAAGIMKYVNSSEFAPETEITKEQLDKLFA